MSQRRINIITIGVILSLFLASMESTVVATAMPSIVAQLGGLSIYSWVFSIYMLASTTTVPIYGKISDILGILTDDVVGNNLKASKKFKAPGHFLKK